MKTKHLWPVFLLLFKTTVYAEENFSLEINIDQLNYVKPIKGVGKAGFLKFKTVNLNNNGIVLNLNNNNNNFDAQIFTRPTFLGFTTQSGNFGMSILEKSALNAVTKTIAEDTNLILDESQLNVAGSRAEIFNNDFSVALKNYRLYCQGQVNSMLEDPKMDTPTNDIMKNCFKFLTLNGSNKPSNEFAELEFTAIKDGDKIYTKGNLKSLDLRPNEILLDLKNIQYISNDTYIINANNLKINCAKDADLSELNIDKIKKACTNKLKVYPVTAVLKDQKNQTMFNLDLTNLQVEKEIAYIALKTATISDKISATSILNTTINCKKSPDSDVLNLVDVLNDCLTYGKISIAEVKSTKNLDANSKDSATKNILISSTNSNLILQSDIRFLGMTKKVTIYAKGSMHSDTREFNIAVTDVKLPFGINSVKLLMYFLKKNIVSKDVSISNNTIKIKF